MLDQHRFVRARRSPLNILAPLSAAMLLALAACGGGGGSSGSTPPVGVSSPIASATPTPSASSSPSPSPSPKSSPTAAPSTSPTASANSVMLSPSSLSFDAAGAGAPTLSVAAAQVGNTTGYALTTTTCAGIVSVAPTSGAGPFVFTPVTAGNCSYTVTGIGGASLSASLSITVTTTVVTQQ